MSEILDELYLSGMSRAKNDTYLQETGITHILNVALECKYKIPKNITHTQMFLKDEKTFPIGQYLDQAADYINKVITEEKGTILVHCYQGVSRSATIVIAYLMKYHNMSYKEALEFSQEKRYEVNPNEGFQKALQLYEEQLNSSKKGQNKDKFYKGQKNKKKKKEFNWDGEIFHDDKPDVIPIDKSYEQISSKK